MFFRHLTYRVVENDTVMSVVIEASKPAGISFNVSVLPHLLSSEGIYIDILAWCIRNIV